EVTPHASPWDYGVPSFSVLWLSEPDSSQHETGLASAESLKALRGCDRNLSGYIEELKSKNVLSKTDLLVVSDHGFSTVEHAVDVAGLLTVAGFKAVHEFKSAPGPGEILVVSLGGSVTLYVTGHDSSTTKRLIEFFQQQDFTGVIF